jgi:hypothetical protein
LLVGKSKNKFDSLQADVEQVIEREAKTATLLSHYLFTLCLRAGGFAPRHLSS